MENKRQATIYDFARMCNSHDECRYCPTSHYNNSKGCGCIKLIQQCTDEASEIILKWCDKHAAKTYADDFFEKFPNAERRSNSGRPNICINRIYPGTETDCDHKTCDACWAREYKKN